MNCPDCGKETEKFPKALFCPNKGTYEDGFYCKNCNRMFTQHESIAA